MATWCSEPACRNSRAPELDRAPLWVTTSSPSTVSVASPRAVSPRVYQPVAGAVIVPRQRADRSPRSAKSPRTVGIFGDAALNPGKFWNPKSTLAFGSSWTRCGSPAYVALLQYDALSPLP